MFRKSVFVFGLCFAQSVLAEEIYLKCEPIGGVDFESAEKGPIAMLKENLSTLAVTVDLDTRTAALVLTDQSGKLKSTPYFYYKTAINNSTGKLHFQDEDENRAEGLIIKISEDLTGTATRYAMRLAENVRWVVDYNCEPYYKSEN